MKTKTRSPKVLTALAAFSKTNRAARKRGRTAGTLLGAALLCLAGPALRAQADPLDHWTLRTHSATQNSLVGVAYGNGQFVAGKPGKLGSHLNT